MEEVHNMEVMVSSDEDRMEIDGGVCWSYWLGCISMLEHTYSLVARLLSPSQPPRTSNNLPFTGTLALPASFGGACLDKGVHELVAL